MPPGWGAAPQEQLAQFAAGYRHIRAQAHLTKEKEDMHMRGKSNRTVFIKQEENIEMYFAIMVIIHA